MELQELRERVLNSGLRFNEEDLEGYDEDQLEAILEAAERVPEPESLENEDDGPDDDPEPAANEEDEEEEAGPVVNEQMEAWLAVMSEIGGPEEVGAVLRDLKHNADSQHQRLVSRLAANEQCRLTEDDLQGLNTAMLRRLQETLEPIDYSGLGGGMLTNVDGEETEELPMPSIED